MPTHRVRAIVKRAGRSPISVWALALICIAAFACSSPSEDDSSATPVTDASRTGEEIFAATCATCHGVYGEGHPNWHRPNADGTLPPPPLNGDGHTWHHGDGFLYRMVRDGGKWLESPSLPHFKSGMPAFGEQLSHDEIVGSDWLREKPVGRQDGPGVCQSGSGRRRRV